MNLNNNKLRHDEGLVVNLRKLYESFGYRKFKMKKFEQYDLYLKNKSFLRNGNVITVTDPAGRLLALKPDITLSIVKNVRSASLPQKFYYNENIYVADSEAGEIKELTQVGLEYFGNLDIRAMGEILLLAAKSLSDTDENYKIAISHMGIVTEVLDVARVDAVSQKQIFKLISQKNLHGIIDICSKLGLDDKIKEQLCGLVKIHGNLNDSISKASELYDGESSLVSISELSQLSEIIESFGLSDKFVLDFTVMNDVRYYNGLVFQGFINGIPKTVLSGGRYDNLVKSFGCDASAAGFAVMTDLLKEFCEQKPEYDCDVFLLYPSDVKPYSVLKAQLEINCNGESCVALCNEPEWLRYKRKIVMSADGSIKDE